MKQVELDTVHIDPEAQEMVREALSKSPDLRRAALHELTEMDNKQEDPATLTAMALIAEDLCEAYNRLAHQFYHAQRGDVSRETG